MDDVQKMNLKAEISMLKSLASAVNSQTSVMNSATFPVVGPVVTIPALPAAGQAIKIQNDVITKLLTVLDKVIDAA